MELSTTLADQLMVGKIPLEKPLLVQLAVQGSRTRASQVECLGGTEGEWMVERIRTHAL
jgi:hypothetical protein